MAQQDAEAHTKRENKEDGKVYLNHRLIISIYVAIFFYSHTNHAILKHRERLYAFQKILFK